MYIFIARFAYKNTQVELCIYLYVYLCILYSMYWISNFMHADRILRQLPLSH